MGYTRQQWSLDFLHALGNSNPSPDTVNWVAGWTTAETGCCSGASFNLLNTTEPNTPGVVSDFNSVGVKNYNNYANGIAANAKVVQNGLYPNLLAALRANNIPALSAPGAQHDLSIWCGGCGYGKNFTQLGAQTANQTFGGQPMPVTTSTGQGGTQQGQSPFTAQTGGVTNAPTASACAPFDIACALGNFWSLYLLPFFEHMLLFVVALVLIIVGFFLLGGNKIIEQAGKGAAVTA